MRCNNCNIDLAENAKVCPLCAAKAVDEECSIKGLNKAEYPKYKGLRKNSYYIRKNDVYFGKRLMAVLAIAIAVLFAGGILMHRADMAGYKAIPIMLGVAAIAYLVTSLVSKRFGEKSAVYLIMIAVVNIIICAVAFITHKTLVTACFSLASLLAALISLIVLALRYPKEMKEELSGRFNH